MSATRVFGLGLLAILLAGCARSPSTSPASAASVAAEASLPPVVVHRSPTCGCCGKWVEHMRRAGFTVEVVDHDDMAAEKARAGVPQALASCHTAEVGGYFVEGHVPPDIVKRLLRERPKALGIAVPGMPAGSPGMEVPSGEIEPYDVMLVAKDGAASTYSQVRP
jgi:hypothetical protein